MNYRYLLVTILLNVTFFLSGMELPQPQREKRSLEEIVEPETKFQKLEWHNIDRWLIRLPEQERLAQFAQIIKQTPSLNFWAIANDAVVSLFPSTSDMNISEAWNTLRQVLINQMNSASPHFKIQLAQLALANEGHFGVRSLIGYLAYTVASQPWSVDLRNILEPIIIILISQANEETQFKALYMVISQLGLHFEREMFATLDVLVKAGINLFAKDPFGKTIIDYINENKIPRANQLPVDRLKAYFNSAGTNSEVILF